MIKSVQVYDGDGLFDNQYILADEATKIILELKGGLILLERYAKMGVCRKNNNWQDLPPLDLKEIEAITSHAQAIYDWLNDREPYEPAAVAIMKLGSLAAECMQKGFNPFAVTLTKIVDRITKVYESRRR